MDPTARILTIEDEPGIRDGIVAYLEDSGFEMLQARDGRTGLAVFREQSPDVVLCDLRLPGLDGLELLSVITSESPETPVIVVSGVGLIGDAVQALKRGAFLLELAQRRVKVPVQGFQGFAVCAISAR